MDLDYLETVTALAQRVRAAHPTAGIYEAADFQWWWGRSRSADSLAQLFWFDDTGRPESAAIAIDWAGTTDLIPVVLPGTGPDWIARVVERGLAIVDAAGLEAVGVVIDRADVTLIGVLADQGLTQMDDELGDAWLSVDARPEVSGLPSGHRLVTRSETAPTPHHLATRNGPEVEERLLQTSLYRVDLDLVVVDGDDNVAAYGLFWFDSETRTGLVEPMRTEDGHQGRGLARHVLTTGINRLFDLGAHRVKIAWDPANTPAHKLYTSVGFGPARECAVASRPAEGAPVSSTA